LGQLLYDTRPTKSLRQVVHPDALAQLGRSRSSSSAHGVPQTSTVRARVIELRSCQHHEWIVQLRGAGPNQIWRQRDPVCSHGRKPEPWYDVSLASMGLAKYREMAWHIMLPATDGGLPPGGYRRSRRFLRR
jgi:hypothetical protein